LSVHEHLEHAEHIAHAGGGHGGDHGEGHHHGSGGLGRGIGVTMAILGALIAFGSAMVGGARTELVATMIEHANVTGQVQAISTKYRVQQAELQQIHSLLAEVTKIKESQAQLAQLRADASRDAASAAIARALEGETKKILDTLRANRADVGGFVELAARYTKERELAQEWEEGFEDVVKIHETAAERFEIATLLAEIGVVMASIALLLHSRKTWTVSLLCSVASVALLVYAFAGHRKLAAAQARVESAREKFEAAEVDSAVRRADEELVREITGQEQRHVAVGEHNEHAERPEHPEHPGAEPAGK
jgi:hypothetical protein